MKQHSIGGVANKLEKTHINPLDIGFFRYLSARIPPVRALVKPRTEAIIAFIRLKSVSFYG